MDEIPNLEEKVFSLVDEASTKGLTLMFQLSHALDIKAKSLKEHITNLDADIKNLEANRN